ncbi:MAG: outer membrane beta-barrel protein [Sulfuritalea sp.]|nr:outer membrane beta-barrel protein [Sulfuritalea sp.]
MFKKCVVFGAGLLVAGVACAQGNWYGGVSLGAATTSIKTENVVTGATAYSFTKDERDTGYKLQAGYQFNKNFALEGGYVNLGKFSATENVTAPVVGSVKGDWKADGWNLFAVGIMPLGQDFSVYGKLGTIYSTLKTDITTSGAVFLAAGTPANRKRTEFDWAYGLGVQYDINKALSVRAEWERFDRLGNEGTNATGQYNFNLYSVGLNFKF